MIAMAQSLSKETIAEGVEDAAQQHCRSYPDEFLQYFLKKALNKSD
jgi:sensor c-di-GMP phosphodiesterase-like protein